MLFIILFIAICFVAFTNGANANFKGVASLYGSGTTSLRTALYWGTGMTFLGSMTALFVSQGLVTAFSGKDLVPDEMVKSQVFVCAAAIGAALTSFIATRLGFPVSTTHALVGSLIGAGLVGSPSGVNFKPLWNTFLYPLLVSPFVAAILGALVYWVLRFARLAPDHRTKQLDVCHFFTAGAASFARGLNDTPKVVGLMTIMPQIEIHWSFLIISVLIAIGGLMDADKVAETLGKKITEMNPGQGFAANLVTATLVTAGALKGLPLSTTHVSVGALLGMGASTGQAKWKKVFEIFLAWITTVPCGALIAGTAYLIINAIAG